MNCTSLAGFLSRRPHGSKPRLAGGGRQSRHRHLALLRCGAVLLFAAPPLYAAEPLNDEQLDYITAGAADESKELLEFNITHETASGRRVQVDGSIDVERLRSMENASLLLQDSAQSNLKSLININAVQSAVNVLVNLNITIDSTVGEIRQLNLSSALPAVPVRPGR